MQTPGTTGFLTFTPQLQCDLLEVTCEGQPMQVENCTPQRVSAGGDLQGELVFMTVGEA